MSTVIDTLRMILGTPNFYSNGIWDYGAFFEYGVSALLLLIVITSVFKFIRCLIK